MVLKHKGSPSGPYATEKTTVSINFANLDPATVKRVTAALTGLRTTDMVVSGLPAAFAIANVGVAGARCTAADVVEVALSNPTAGTITVNTVVMDITILRFS